LEKLSSARTAQVEQVKESHTGVPPCFFTHREVRPRET
jgi:hypothetical protein